MYKLKGNDPRGINKEEGKDLVDRNKVKSLSLSVFILKIKNPPFFLENMKKEKGMLSSSMYKDLTNNLIDSNS